MNDINLTPKEDRRKQTILERYLPNLEPVSSIPQNFWRLDSKDLINIGIMAAFIIIIWILSFLQYGSLSVISYWDGPNYIYAGICLYNVPPDNLWTRSFRYPPSYFACHLPGFPLAIRFFSTLVFNHFALGAHIAILVISCLLIYIFRRLLTIYNCVSDPAFTSLLLIFFPLRFTIYHSVCASEPLFVLYVSLAFIFLKTNQMLPLCLSICGACITRIEGLSILGTIGLCYLLRLDIIRAFIVGLCIVAPFSIVLLHKVKFNDWLAYIHFNQNSQGLVRLSPFFEIINHFRYNDELIYSNSCIYLFCPFIIGTFMLYTVSIPFAIFSTVYVLFVSMVFHMDIFRYAIPGFVFALFVGFDPIISSPHFKKVFWCFIPLYTLYLFKMIPEQIHSNSAPPWFTNIVLQSPVSYH